MADTTVLEINQAFENRGEKKCLWNIFLHFHFLFLMYCRHANETTGKHFLESPITTKISNVINYSVFSHLSLAPFTHADF